MTCKCDNCLRGEDEVELEHICAECRADSCPQVAPSKEIPDHISKLWDLLIEEQADPSHVVHVLTMHPGEVDKYFMHAMAVIQLACEILDKEYPYTGPG